MQDLHLWEKILKKKICFAFFKKKKNSLIYCMTLV